MMTQTTATMTVAVTMTIRSIVDRTSFVCGDDSMVGVALGTGVVGADVLGDMIVFGVDVMISVVFGTVVVGVEVLVNMAVVGLAVEDTTIADSN